MGGKPESSKLHVHPLTLAGSEHGDEISVISNQFFFDDKFKRDDFGILDRVQGKTLWVCGVISMLYSVADSQHSDITFENVPSDYATLQIRQMPPVGGDTLWASAYEAYDRLSPAYQRFLEGLTATHVGQHFVDLAKRNEKIVMRENRGSPENIGQDLTAVHPIVRTNPVTGWKGLFVNREFTKQVNGLTKGESDALLEFLFDHISSVSFFSKHQSFKSANNQNHDLQVRFRWEANSLAIWDNRSTFHAATHDLDEIKRTGTRSVSLGERPYLDPKSTGRREGLKAAKGL